MNDFGTATANDTLRIERILPGPIERVWSYLTESDRRGAWLAAGDMELEVGGRVELVFNNSSLTDNDDPPPAKYAQHACESRLTGRITACDAPRLLAYTWGDGKGEREPSEVRFELSERGEDVHLVVTHRRLANRQGLLSVAGGWHTHLGILADRINGRSSNGFWRTLGQVEAEYARRIPE